MIETGLESLVDHICPDCGRFDFLRGPAGGLSVNIECAACGSRFNVARIRGEVCVAQRIPHNGVWPDRGGWP
jgi:hypothetical protein